MSDALEDVVDIALRVAEALEKVGASYLSAEVWPARSTGNRAPPNDIDFVIDMAVGKVRELSELLGTDFESTPTQGERFRNEKQHRGGEFQQALREFRPSTIFPSAWKRGPSSPSWGPTARERARPSYPLHNPGKDARTLRINGNDVTTDQAKVRKDIGIVFQECTLDTNSRCART